MIFQEKNCLPKQVARLKDFIYFIYLILYFTSVKNYMVTPSN